MTHFLICKFLQGRFAPVALSARVRLGRLACASRYFGGETQWPPDGRAGETAPMLRSVVALHNLIDNKLENKKAEETAEKEARDKEKKAYYFSLLNFFQT